MNVNETGTPVEKSVLFEDAYERLLPQMQSLRDDELQVVNLDIPTAVFTVIGIQPELNALRDDISKMHDLDTERVLSVGLYARALGRAHALYLAAAESTDTLKSLTEEGTALREVLLADANALVRRKLMNGDRLRELAGPSGYKNLAFDLEVLGAVFQDHFPKIRDKWGIEKAQINRALEIAAAIAVVVGEREQSAARVAGAADLRMRAFTLFVRTYDEVRRAVSYLRWHKADVNEIAPSLYLNRGRRKDAGAVTPAPTDPGVVPVTDAPIVTPTTVPLATAPVTPFTPGKIGTPDAGPFIA